MAPLSRRAESPHCAVQINSDGASCFTPAQPRVDRQLVRALRRKLRLELEAQELLDEEQQAGDDPDGECLLSKVLAVAMSLAVGGFIYLVVLQRFYLVRATPH